MKSSPITFYASLLTAVSTLAFAGMAQAQFGGPGMLNNSNSSILSGTSQQSHTAQQIQSDTQQAQTIQAQIQADAQKQAAERQKIQVETQQKIMNMMQDVTENKVKNASKSNNAADAYVRGAPPPAEVKLFTYEEFLNFPTFVYTATEQNEMSWMYQPQGEQASRGGASGADAVPWLSLRGDGRSLSGMEGSLGGLYTLLSEIYAPGREFNTDEAYQMAMMNSRAGTYVPGSAAELDGLMLDPALREAIANGSLLNIIHGQPIQLVQLPSTSTGGLSNLALILPLSFKIFDFGVEDGDNITLTIFDKTGQRYTNTFNLTNAGSIINPAVIAGPVELRVHANNEGSLSPNTGQIDILSTVTSGPTSQQFNLSTGQTGSMSITAAPQISAR